MCKGNSQLGTKETTTNDGNMRTLLGNLVQFLKIIDITEGTDMITRHIFQCLWLTTGSQQHLVIINNTAIGQSHGMIVHVQLGDGLTEQKLGLAGLNVGARGVLDHLVFRNVLVNGTKMI